MILNYSFLLGIKHKGIRNKNWFRLNRLEKGLYDCALIIAKLKGRISSMKLILILAKIIVKLKNTYKARIIKEGRIMAERLKALFLANKVFNWAYEVKEWFKDKNFIFYLGLMKVF